jgi:hypothetical protein
MTNMTEVNCPYFHTPGKKPVIGLLQHHFHIEAYIGPGEYGPRLRLRPILLPGQLDTQYTNDINVVLSR